MRSYQNPNIVLLTLLVTTAAHAQVPEFVRAPVRFEENRGQLPEDVAFVARGTGQPVAIGAGVVTLGTGDVRLVWNGTAAGSEPRGWDELPGVVHVYRGNDPARWTTHIPTFAHVRQTDLYEGIDLVYYGIDGGSSGSQLEFDLVVAPGADPGQASFDVEGADAVELDDRGNLILTTPAGDVSLQCPVVYQLREGRREPVGASYAIDDECPTRIGFALDEFDPSLELVIDPVLAYGTYLGNIRSVFDIDLDPAGNILLCGDFIDDGLVMKFDPSGTTLLYETIVGASAGAVRFVALDTDSGSNVHVGGSTRAFDFPVTGGPFQATFGGGNEDGVVAKLSPTGTLEEASYFGGSGWDNVYDLTANPGGGSWITGGTRSTDLPLALPFQGTLAGSSGTSYVGGDAFVAEIDLSYSSLQFSSYLGGPGWDAGYGIQVNGSGAYVCGRAQSGFPTTTGPALSNPTDTFVTRLTGRTINYSRYVSGTSSNNTGRSLAIEASGTTYVVSQSNYDWIVRSFDSSGAMNWETPLAGSGQEDDDVQLVLAGGNLFLSGSTYSFNLPLFEPLQVKQGLRDGYIASLSTAGALRWATYYGGHGNVSVRSIAADAAGRAYVIGTASYTLVPITPATAYDPLPNPHYEKEFLAFLDPGQPPCVIPAPPHGSEARGDVNLQLEVTGANPVTIVFDYSTDDGVTYFPATDAGTGTITGNPTAPVAPGLTDWTWESAADLVGSVSGVEFRLTVTDTITSGTSTCFIQFEVDNRPRLTITSPLSTSLITTAVPIEFTVENPTGNTVTATFSSTPPGGFGTATDAGTGSLTGNPTPPFLPGSTDWVWDAPADVPQRVRNGYINVLVTDTVTGMAVQAGVNSLIVDRSAHFESCPDATRSFATPSVGNSWYGSSLAGDGDTAVIGADIEAGMGAAYVRERHQGGAGNWGQVRRLVASDLASNWRFGNSTAIADDTVIVGAFRAASPASANAGAAYVFERNLGGSANWGERTKVAASDGASNDNFALSVALSGDTLVVGAPGHDASAPSGGAAYVFERNAGGMDSWGEVKKLVASDAGSGDQFGTSVAISGDTIAVGAMGEAAVYIFERNRGFPGAWMEVAKLPHPTSPTGFWEFGAALALDENTLVVGAPNDLAIGVGHAGTIYVFERGVRAPGTWSAVPQILATGAFIAARFGESVDVDGDLIVVGSSLDHDAGGSGGSVSVFERDRRQVGSWAEAALILPVAGGEELGTSCALAGGTVLGGARRARDPADPPNGAHGAVYIFDCAFLNPGCGALCGDCNLDGAVNAVDALIAAQHSAGVSLLTPGGFSACNVTAPFEPDALATVDVLDVLEIARYSAQLITTLSCC